MPHFTHAPEILLGRNDSKNPETTCKGITSSGRPCRRALAAIKTSLTGRRTSNDSAIGGVVALVHEDGELQEVDFYCWQHKYQAEQMTADEAVNDDRRKNRIPNRRSTELFPLKEKSSIDTMVQKLGIDTVDSKERRKRTKNPKPPRRTETLDFAAVEGRQSGAPHAEKYNLGGSSQRPQGKAKKKSFWSSLCCMGGDDDDYVEIVRHRKRVERESQVASVETKYSNSCTTPAKPPRQPVASTSPCASPMNPAPSPIPTAGNILSWIPTHLSPTTASALLAELSKPVSVHDEEGYIYIFWLTPQSNNTPSESTARSLLAPPGSSARPRNTRRISDVMTEYSFDGDESSRGVETSRGDNKRSAIMLKIGRANNITRRMNEWQRQCGYALNLVRWYPYVSSSTQPSPKSERQVLYPDLSGPAIGRMESSGEGVRKVPCVKRVERLIHLELGEKQAKRQCTACGKEHREWFEVEATQAGIKAIDEVVKRWVRWSEGQV